MTYVYIIPAVLFIFLVALFFVFAKWLKEDFDSLVENNILMCSVTMREYLKNMIGCFIISLILPPIVWFIIK